MRQSEAKDLRSFLEEPVEEIVVEGAKGCLIHSQQDTLEDVGVRLTSPWDDVNPWDDASPLQDTSAPSHEVGTRLTSPWEGTSAQLQGAGVCFTTPWEGTGGQLHEVGARFTSPLGSPLGISSRTTDDFTLQQTMPIARIPDVGARFTSPLGTPLGTSPLGSPLGTSPLQGTTVQALRPYRLQRYQSRGVPVALTHSASGTVRLRPASDTGQRMTADLAPASHKIVPGEPSPALQSWERRRHDMYMWLVLLLLFLLVVLGGIGLDSLIASYR